MAIKHAYQTAQANDATKEVSATRWNQDHVIDSQVEFPYVASPTTPSANTAAVFAKRVGGRMIPAWIGPSGLSSTVQASWARNKIALYTPIGNATTAPTPVGWPTWGTAGTATARNVATTNFLTRMKRLAYVSSSVSGSLASIRSGVAQYTTGTGTGLGGFYTVFRFGVSDAATVSGARMFVGVSSSTAAATNVEPSTLTNSVGVAQLSTDATQWYIVYGGSAAQTAIALGTSLGAPTDTTTCWELALFSNPNANGVVGYSMTNLATNVVVEGTLTPATPGTQTPANTTLLNHQMWRSNNATAAAVGFDICSVYCETDN